MKKRIKIIGGGLAGSEAAYSLLKEGFFVDLYEMRPAKMTPAHHTAGLAELVCSNSLKSEDGLTAQGLLKAEMRALDSLILKAADVSRVPAGGALAVDRAAFSNEVEKILTGFPGLNIIREECAEIDDYTIVASGPLTSDRLAEEAARVTGADRLYFYDAAAPIITKESVDMSSAYYMSRYGKGDPDYLNCPMAKAEYEGFYEELINAETVILKDFEKGEVFEGCMPVEVLAKRGKDALRFGPLRPVGLGTKDKAYAVLQLRKEDNYGSLLNMVGFQTNLTFREQKRVFGLIPALKDAEFVRYGVMHRNTYIDSTKVLTRYFNLKDNPAIFFAGQITGVEGYMESAVSGIIAGINMARLIRGEELIIPSENTMTGSLARYISGAVKNFQPMHVSFSLTPELDGKFKKKEERRAAYAARAIEDIKTFNKLRGI